MYENEINRRKNISIKGGTINQHMDKMNQENLIAKTVHFFNCISIF